MSRWMRASGLMKLQHVQQGELHRIGLENRSEMQGVSHSKQPEMYMRMFRRESDRKKCKCSSERERSQCEQVGAVQCVGCNSWLCS